MGECRDLKGSAVRSVVLGIRLVGATARNRDQIAADVLKNEKVLLAIHEAFRKQAGAMIGAQVTGESLDADAAKKFVTAVGEAAKPQVMKEIKKQKEYTEAAAGLKKLKCAFAETPVGVFVDKNKTWLIIAGVVVAAGSAVAMYKAESGDVPAKAMTAIANLAAETIEVGDFEFGVKGLEFKPSERAVSGTAKVALSAPDAVKLTFEVSAAVKGGELKSLSVAETVVVPLAKDTKLSIKSGAGVKEDQPTWDFALTVKRKPSKPGLVLNVSAYAKGEGPGVALGTKASAGYLLDTTRILGPHSHAVIGAQGHIETKRPDTGSPFQPSGGIGLGLSGSF